MTFSGPADLVLEGGGVKGIGLVGAVTALGTHGYRFGEPGPGRIAGASAGAIVGAMLAAGMDHATMHRKMSELDYSGLADGSRWVAGRALSLATRLGVHRGDALHKWIRAELAALGVHTFGDLRYDDPDGPQPPDRSYRLVVVVSDVSSGRMVRLPQDYARYGLEPDEQSVADAVRASASIPLFYRPVRLRADNGRTSCLVDGGLLANYPITIFDREDGAPPRWPTFGVKLSSQPPPSGPFPQWRPVRTPLEYGKALVATMAEAHDRRLMDEPALVARTVFVDTAGVAATDFTLDDARRENLYANGEEAAQKFLLDWDFADYIARFRR